MRAYAETAEMVGDMHVVMAAMAQIGVDRDTLVRESRLREALGADRLVAGMARRLCAIAAPSREAAEHKIKALVSIKADVLAADEPYRPTEASGALLMAMMDSAILIETRTWPATQTRH
jgi:hypothetical protein